MSSEREQVLAAELSAAEADLQGLEANFDVIQETNGELCEEADRYKAAYEELDRAIRVAGFAPGMAELRETRESIAQRLSEANEGDKG